MDKEVRNTIQRATQRMRSLLETEYAAQLEGTFDIFADGTVNKQPGAHLDPQQVIVREKIVAAISHIAARGEKPADAVATYLREAAFTFLNRMVALKLAEARGLIQECVSRGDQSSGFKEFCGLAPGLAQLPDHGYRLYLESLFDELGREVGVLFDRRDPASLLWPRRQTFEDLLETQNDEDLAGVWSQDETLGWIYQYFNSKDERKQMRDAGAPRNSRELAVRNQFFTPRYVVELLTDNTLGRLWYEMRKGNTALLQRCTYLVRRPREVFLTEGQPTPAPAVGKESLAQKELLRPPEPIPHRPKKDPREIRMIDPAGGSGHFALYCFDVFQVIYREAWDDPDLGPALRRDFAGQEAFDRAMPRLILQHNLHLVDIDPRACQIAALALWMRAHRAWNELGTPVAHRPAITQVNVACAEPMPGERELLDELVAAVRPPLLGQLVRAVFETMRLAGEAGSLLRIEEDLKVSVAKARTEWQANGGQRQLGLFADQEPARPRQLELFDLTGISDAQLFDNAEELVLAQLRALAVRGAADSSRRRLFADDAAQGFAFIDLCRKTYDVALMNPPFGAACAGAKAYIDTTYPRSRNDLLAAFVECWLGRLHRGGRLGAITSRTAFFLSSFQRWREDVVLGEAYPAVFTDLGYGVMDDAMVEAAAYVLERA